ncbi:MAG TPA: AGE family epimerase/isomerase [Kineosporiaceae bacterium]|nr:AGE family epimerase/isomerase [Kineosporiaceae bacterium]
MVDLDATGHRELHDVPHSEERLVISTDPVPPAEPPSLAWLDAERNRLLDGAVTARAEQGGFWWLDADGRPDRSRPRFLWISTRMTHCFALGLMLGRDQDAELVDHGVASLLGAYTDVQHGGWFAALDQDNRPVPAPKGAYEHAFVLLAACSASAAGRPGADRLLALAADVMGRRFWDDEAGAMVEEWDAGWTTCDPYRGANANMHSLEACLAAADATGDGVWRDRALRIATRLIHGGARAHGWRVPEHFDADWKLLPEYNADQPNHPFRPYGVTPGHGLEWARLMLHLDAALDAAGEPAPAWLREAAAGLFDRAVTDGWDAERGGFAYTTGWDGRPVVSQRFHWVVCEGIATATLLHRLTGEQRYADWYARLWRYARSIFLDGRPGWLHEAEIDGRPSTATWTGRPDIYHVVQATLVPRLPLAPSFASALAANLLR